MFPFDGKYLKVMTPQTTNGTDLKIDDETDKIVYKESHLPLSALKSLEAQNEQLPKSLRKKITIIDSDIQRKDPEADKVLVGKGADPALKGKKAVDELLK